MKSQVGPFESNGQVGVDDGGVNGAVGPQGALPLSATALIQVAPFRFYS
jgi:hypothetical protein